MSAGAFFVGPRAYNGVMKNIFKPKTKRDRREWRVESHKQAAENKRNERRKFKQALKEGK